MSNYMIFVVVLTIAYIIYYGYNISKDLYGKKDEKTSGEVETFDIADMQDVVATPVRESSDGFSLGDNSYEPLPEPVEETSDEPASDSKVKSYIAISEQLEEANVQSEGGCTNEELHAMMMNKDPNVTFKPKITGTRECY